jgi:thymidylate synthase
MGLKKRHIEAETIDDLVKCATNHINENGNKVKASRGVNQEVTGVLLELKNPRARLSRSATRGKIFSALGELLWYLSGSSDLDFISHYLPDYTKYGTEYGAYGPRLFDLNGHNQVQNVISLLSERETTRRAAIQILRAEDIEKDGKDIPCTCNIQFMLREGKLKAITYMRSNDIYRGINHDIFSFTMIQELISRSLGVEVGTYIHKVGSLHLYERDKEKMRDYLDEGWQSTEKPMPPMPNKDPWKAVDKLINAESDIRKGDFSENIDKYEKLDTYWEDIIRLLRIYSYYKEGNKRKVYDLKSKLNYQMYTIFVDSALKEVS